MQWQYSVVLQHVSIGGNWEQCTRDLSVVLFTTACEFPIISIIVLINKIEPGLTFLTSSLLLLTHLEQIFVKSGFSFLTTPAEEVLALVKSLSSLYRDWSPQVTGILGWERSPQTTQRHGVSWGGKWDQASTNPRATACSCIKPRAKARPQRQAPA